MGHAEVGYKNGGYGASDTIGKEDKNKNKFKIQVSVSKYLLFFFIYLKEVYEIDI